ncbi:DUF4123 domain-containing protein [Pseudomonas carnis]|uniref:DUF4123 domain-containing protein n=1 Tax=Pseudomonas carnis TaxID=2487355 RepID=UPI0018D93D04|nr:DUF4123 domain-containing protein [Pseudomonas carnis]MBH3465184.1 DUF4123 domain-containing protein [Pseudomonas carnis]
MNTLLEPWHLAAQQVKEAHPALQRYLLIDAAQLPINALPWKDLVERGHVENLLTGQPEASAPDVCALLIAYESHWVDGLLARLLARRPFAFTLLASDLPHKQLANALARKTSIALSGHRTGLMRFYDSAVLQSLIEVLGPRRSNALLSEAQAWMFVRRDGKVETLTLSMGQQGRSWAWELKDRDLQALERLSLVDRITAQLRWQGVLAVNSDPIQTYQAIFKLCGMLSSDKEPEEKQLYQVCALILPVAAKQLSDPDLQSVIEQYRDEQVVLLEQLFEWVESMKEGV